MFTKKKIVIGLSLCSLVLFSACNSSEATGLDYELEKGSTYQGKNATHEIIEVESSDRWKIKSENVDDTNYSIVDVTTTGEEIGGVSVIELVSDEVMGDIESSFAKREGREFLMVEHDGSLYFRSVSDSNKADIESNIADIEDKEQHIMDIANYIFNES